MPVNGTRTALKVKAAIFIIFWCWCCYCCYYFDGGVSVFVGGVGVVVDVVVAVVGVVVVVVVVALFVSLMRSRLDLYLTRFWAQKNLFTTGIRSV